MTDEIFIYDNIIDSVAQKYIQQICFNKIKWQFIADVTNPNNKQQRPGFLYYFKGDPDFNYYHSDNVSNYHTEMMPIVNEACDRINFKRKDVIQGRSFLQLPLNLKEKEVDAPHVDTDIDHLVVLYYVNDSDGDTVIYENIFEGYDKVPHYNDLKEKKRVTPKAGRVVIFNGKHWNTSCQPEHNTRCIVNYNII